MTTTEHVMLMRSPPWTVCEPRGSIELDSRAARLEQLFTSDTASGRDCESCDRRSNATRSQSRLQGQTRNYLPCVLVPIPGRYLDSRVYRSRGRQRYARRRRHSSTTFRHVDGSVVRRGPHDSRRWQLRLATTKNEVTVHPPPAHLLHTST
jgi:hypothetical protein